MVAEVASQLQTNQSQSGRIAVASFMEPRLNTQQMTYAYLSLCNAQLSYLQITLFYSFKLSYKILNLRSEIASISWKKKFRY